MRKEQARSRQVCWEKEEEVIGSKFQAEGPASARGARAEIAQSL